MDLPLLHTTANSIFKRVASKSDNSGMLPLTMEVELYKKLLQFFQIGDYYYFIFNFKTLGFDFMSNEVENVLGYPPSLMDINFFMDKIHPDDRPWFLEFQNQAIDFLAQLPVDKLMKYKLRHDYRMRKSNGEYIRILQQCIVLQADEKGDIMHTLIVQTDITYLKQDGKSVMSYIGLDGEPSFLNLEAKNTFVENKNNLTKREKQILLLMVDGRLSKEISDILNISKDTVDTHRKNMLRKNKLNNAGELIGKAIRYGWI